MPVKTIDLPGGVWLHLQWFGFSIHGGGLGFYLGWFPDLDLIGLQIMFLEWTDDDHLVPFRLQLLYFLVCLQMDRN